MLSSKYEVRDGINGDFQLVHDPMKRRVVIAVGIASHPIAAAGNAWFSLNWALGFRHAGWDVWLVESIAADACVDKNWQPCAFAQSANLFAWHSTLGRFGLLDCATLLVDGSAANLESASAFARTAEVFLNLSGHFRDDAVRFPSACKVYVDVDPGFTQVWADAYGCDMNFSGHDRFVSVGLRLGQDGTFAPDCGLKWIPTFPPVVLDFWPDVPQGTFDRFTTIAHWEGYKSSEWMGKWFTGKREEFERVRDLPMRGGLPLEVATDTTSHAEELNPYRSAGWRFADAADVCSDLDSYAKFIRGSSAEFSVAKGGYVLSRTGWFSDRSVCYAATGRPLILQNTGVGDWLPDDCGIHFFDDIDGAHDACSRVMADFSNEQKKVRRVAETIFNSDVVIKRLVREIGV